MQQQHVTNLLWQKLESLQVHCFLFVSAYFVLASVFHQMDSYSLSFQKKIELETRLSWPKQIKASASISHQHVIYKHSVCKKKFFISNIFFIQLTKKKKKAQHLRTAKNPSTNSSKSNLSSFKLRIEQLRVTCFFWLCKVPSIVHSETILSAIVCR